MRQHGEIQSRNGRAWTMIEDGLYMYVSDTVFELIARAITVLMQRITEAWANIEQS